MKDTTKEPQVPACTPWLLLLGALVCAAYVYKFDRDEQCENRCEVSLVEYNESKTERYSIPVPLDAELKCDEVSMAFSIGSTSVPMDSFDKPESTIESIIKCQSTQGDISPVRIKHTMEIDSITDADLIPKLVDFYLENELAFKVFEDDQIVEKCNPTGHCLTLNIPDEAFIKSKINPMELSVFYSFVLDDALSTINQKVESYLSNKKEWENFKK